MRILLRSRRSEIAVAVKQTLSFLEPQIGAFKQTQQEIRTALNEALANAIVHGNLEIGSDDRHQSDWEAYEKAVAEREQDQKYSERRVTLEVRADPQTITISIHDLGSGFTPPKTLPTATNRESALNQAGRGLLMIANCVDKVRWNARGNRIMLIKHLPPAVTQAQAQGH